MPNFFRAPYFSAKSMQHLLPTNVETYEKIEIMSVTTMEAPIGLVFIYPQIWRARSPCPTDPLQYTFTKSVLN